MEPTLLVFLHGVGQSPTVWQDLVTAVKATQPMVAPWLKGFKPTDQTKFDTDSAAAAIVDTIEGRGVEQADLVGCDLGGLIALRVAALYPKKIAHLTLISTTLAMKPEETDRQREMIKRILASGIVPDQVTQRLNNALAGLDALEAAAHSVDLSLVTAPILAITAENDIPSRASAALLAQTHQATVKTVKGTVVDLLSHQSTLVAQLITDFNSTKATAPDK